MANLKLVVMSLRYSSWSMRAWLALEHAGARFETETVDLSRVPRQQSRGGLASTAESNVNLEQRRALGSVTGLFPVLWVDGQPVFEALSIGEWVAETYPRAGLWPEGSYERALARSVSQEMASGFANLRTQMGCHVFARVPAFTPDEATQREIERVRELWRDALQRSGGPFLFGRFGMADCMYFPVLTRFRTYGVPLGSHLEGYAQALESCPPVQRWRKEAAKAPRIAAYDEYVRSLGGDPDAALPS